MVGTAATVACLELKVDSVALTTEVVVSAVVIMGLAEVSGG